MNDNEKSIDSYRFFMLMSEIAGDEPLSQREISRRLGIAVGLVNSYMKNLVSKGYVRVKNFPSNRYAYLLTPQGFAEKSRLAYQHLAYFTGLYTQARQDYLILFKRLETEGVRRVAFCGLDEVAEIAYLSLQETGLELTWVLDTVAVESAFFGKPVHNVSSFREPAGVPIVITSLKRHDSLREELIKQGVTAGRIYSLNL